MRKVWPGNSSGSCWRNFDRKDIDHAMALGQMVQIASRFVATKECDADERYKQAYVNARKEDVQIIQSPVGMPGRALCNPFMKLVENGRIPVKKCYNCLENVIQDRFRTALPRH